MKKIYQKTLFGGKNAGFTLIELLVVVLIIGILAAVAVPQYEQAVIRSRFTQTVLAARAIAQAQQTYFMANGVYADQIDDLDVVFSNSEDNNVFLADGYCHIGTYPTKVVCHLRKNNQSGFISLSHRYATNKRICCSYANTNYEGDSLCRAEMKTDVWSDGCQGGEPCHCFAEQ